MISERTREASVVSPDPPAARNNALDEGTRAAGTGATAHSSGEIGSEGRVTVSSATSVSPFGFIPNKTTC